MVGEGTPRPPPRPRHSLEGFLVGWEGAQALPSHRGFPMVGNATQNYQAYP